MKITVWSAGKTVIDADGEYQEPAIRDAIDGRIDIVETIVDYTDTERSDVSHDEYAVVTEDDGTELWRGWLTGDPDAAPPAEAAPEAALADAIDVLYRHRHELDPSALRSLQDIWACASAARYGQPYETWFTEDAEFFATHDTAACETENDEQADGDALLGGNIADHPDDCACGACADARYYAEHGEDGYPDSELEMDLLAYQRNGDDERDDQ